MPVIHTTTTIRASQTAVWSVLSDLASYPNWNPFTYRIQGALRLNESLLINVRFPDGSEVRTKHIVCALQPHTQISWRKTNIFGLLWSRRDQIIEIIDADHVRYLNHEYLWGPLAWVVIWLYGSRIRGGFVAMGDALRQRVEAAPTPAPLKPDP
jgi:hypothetical protein